MIKMYTPIFREEPKIRRHEEHILNTIDSKLSNARVESINNYIENWRRSRDFLSVCRTFDGLQTFAVL